MEAPGEAGEGHQALPTRSGCRYPSLSFVCLHQLLRGAFADRLVPSSHLPGLSSARPDAVRALRRPRAGSAAVTAVAMPFPQAAAR